jgi:hypothetical protein
MSLPEKNLYWNAESPPLNLVAVSEPSEGDATECLNGIPWRRGA